MRFGFDLCSEEMTFLRKRKRYVASALKNVFHLQQDLEDCEVSVKWRGVDLEFLVPSCILLDEPTAKWVTCLLCGYKLVHLS